MIGWIGSHMVAGISIELIIRPGVATRAVHGFTIDRGRGASCSRAHMQRTCVDSLSKPLEIALLNLSDDAKP